MPNQPKARAKTKKVAKARMKRREKARAKKLRNNMIKIERQNIMRGINDLQGDLRRLKRRYDEQSKRNFSSTPKTRKHQPLFKIEISRVLKQMAKLENSLAHPDNQYWK